MKVFTQSEQISLLNKKLQEWVKLILLTGGAQVIIQGIGFICGILIIRILPTREYALYTLANTMLGTMIVLADGDISRTVMALGGKVWKDRKKLGLVISTGFDLRRKLAVVSLILSTPLLLYLLLRHGASWEVAILIVLALIPGFFAALSGTMLDIAPKLQQDIIPLQKIQIETNLGRLIILLLTLYFFPWAFVGLLAAALSQVWANWRLRNIFIKYAEWSSSIDKEIRKKIISMFKRLLPGAVFYCLSGQITIWLISIFGSTAAVAEIGALGRLSLILNVFNIMFLTLVVPRYARMPNNVSLLLKKFIQIELGALVLSFIMVFAFWMFSKEALWVLGSNYSDLNKEVVLSIGGSCIGLIAGAAFTLCVSRGWVINPLVYIPISIASIIIGAVSIDISTLQGVLIFNIFIGMVQLCMYFIYSIFRILRA